MITREQIEQSLQALAAKCGVMQNPPEGWLSINDIAEQWEVNERSARKYLFDLVKRGLLPQGKVYRCANGRSAVHYKII